MILDSEERYSKDNLENYHTKYGNVNAIMNFTRTRCGEVLAHFCFFYLSLQVVISFQGKKCELRDGIFSFAEVLVR